MGIIATMGNFFVGDIRRDITASLTVVRDSVNQVTYTFSATANRAVAEEISVTFVIQNSNGQGGGLQTLVRIPVRGTTISEQIPLSSAIEGAYTAMVTVSAPSPHTLISSPTSIDVPAFL